MYSYSLLEGYEAMAFISASMYSTHLDSVSGKVTGLRVLMRLTLLSGVRHHMKGEFLFLDDKGRIRGPCPHHLVWSLLIVQDAAVVNVWR